MASFDLPKIRKSDSKSSASRNHSRSNSSLFEASLLIDEILSDLKEPNYQCSTSYDHDYLSNIISSTTSKAQEESIQIDEISTHCHRVYQTIVQNVFSNIDVSFEYLYKNAFLSCKYCFWYIMISYIGW